MPSRYDIKVKDIITVSRILKRKKGNFLDFIRPIDKNFLINTVFNWKYRAENVYLTDKQKKWKKIPMKRSENELCVILPLKPGLFQYCLTIDLGKEGLVSFKKKENFFRKFKGFKAIKRLDKEIISSDSILNKEIKWFSNFLQYTKEEGSDINENPKLIPAQLIAALYTKKIFQKNKVKSFNFIQKTEVSKMVFYNHIIFYDKLQPKLKYLNKIFLTRMRIKEKDFSFFFFKFRLKGFVKNFHPVKSFFNLTNC